MSAILWTRDALGHYTSSDLRFLCHRTGGRYILFDAGKRIRRDTLTKCKAVAQERMSPTGLQDILPISASPVTAEPLFMDFADPISENIFSQAPVLNMSAAEQRTNRKKKQNVQEDAQNAPESTEASEMTGESLSESEGQEDGKEREEATPDAVDSPESYLNWLPPELEDHELGFWTVWHTSCKRYRAIRVQTNESVHYGAAYSSDSGRPVIANDLKSLDKALQAVERVHRELFDLQEIRSNREATVESARDSGLAMATSRPKTEEGAEVVLSHVEAVQLLVDCGYKTAGTKDEKTLKGWLGRLTHKNEDDVVEKPLSALLLKRVLESGRVTVSHANGNGNGHAATAEPEEDLEIAPSYSPEPVETVVLDVSQLIFADYNPAHRTDESTAGIKQFAKQLREDGKIYQPILVRPDLRTVIEGHRRATAAKLNGWPKIEARVIHDDPSKVYATVNATPKKHSGAEVLSVWLSAPGAVPVKTGKKMKEVASVLGKGLMKKLLKAGLSTRPFAVAKRIAAYCEMTEDDGSITGETMKTIIEWMLAHDGTVGKAMRALSEKQPMKVIAKAIKENKPLEFTLKD